MKTKMRNTIIRAFSLLTGIGTLLQTPLLLAVRLYWGWQFAQTGWGKLHNIPHVTEFFMSLGIPAPGLKRGYDRCICGCRPAGTGGNLFRSREVLQRRPIHIPVRFAPGLCIWSWKARARFPAEPSRQCPGDEIGNSGSRMRALRDFSCCSC